MKFKVDENLPSEVTALLREVGHDSLSVLDQTLGGADDDKIFNVCREEKRILVTLDLDFANVQAYPPSMGCGIIVLRLVWQDKNTVIAAVRRLLSILKRESPKRKLWIVEGERIRIRS